MLNQHRSAGWTSTGVPRATSKAIRSIPDIVPPENRTLGWSVLEWTTDYLLQPDGPNAGEPWEYTDEQVRIILRWYQIDGQGKFPYRRGVLRRMKGWGKDPFLASISAVELCGPCRFDGFDAEGFPVAVQHPAPWIQIAAASLDQTRNTMRVFPGLFSNAAIDEYQIDPGKTIIYARGKGQIESVTSAPRTLEGGRASLVIMNETQHWVLANEGPAMADAIRRNLGKSRDGSARSMEITNAHLPGEASVAESTYEAWRNANGKVPGLYYDSLEAPPVDDLTDTAAVRKALTVARGDSSWLSVDRLADEIADPVTPEWLSRRYYLNQVVAAGTERWIPAAAWEECADPTHEIPSRANVVLGFDGSFDGDCTAIVACEVGEKPHIQVVECWENPGDPDWRVPVEDVEDKIRESAKKWRVREVTADPYRWQRSLQILANERLPITEFPQRPQRMIPATTRFHEAVINGAMTHDGDLDLARHVENARLKVSSQGGYLTKDSKMSPRKIDLAVAAVMAFERASSHKKKTRRMVSLADALANESLVTS